VRPKPTLAPLFARRTASLGRKKQRYEAVKHQADPEIDEQAQVGQQPKAAVLGSRRQMGHDQEVDRIAQHDRCEGDKKVTRKAHSPPLDTQSRRTGLQWPTVPVRNMAVHEQGFRHSSLLIVDGVKRLRPLSFSVRFFGSSDRQPSLRSRPQVWFHRESLCVFASVSC